MHPARKVKTALIKEGNYAAAKAVDHLVCGSLMDPILEASGPRNEQLCHRCDRKATATRWHELHGCPANAKIDHPHIQKTQWVADKALEQWDQWQCMYARGILPQAWLPTPKEVGYLTAVVWESPGFKQALDQAGAAHSDGTGGNETTPNCVQKVAFGATCFNIKEQEQPPFFKLENLACLGGEVPGKHSFTFHARAHFF